MSLPFLRMELLEARLKGSPLLIRHVLPEDQIDKFSAKYAFVDENNYVWIMDAEFNTVCVPWNYPASKRALWSEGLYEIVQTINKSKVELHGVELHGVSFRHFSSHDLEQIASKLGPNEIFRPRLRRKGLATVVRSRQWEKFSPTHTSVDDAVEEIEERFKYGHSLLQSFVGIVICPDQSAVLYSPEFAAGCGVVRAKQQTLFPFLERRVVVVVLNTEEEEKAFVAQLCIALSDRKMLIVVETNRMVLELRAMEAELEKTTMLKGNRATICNREHLRFAVSCDFDLLVVMDAQTINTASQYAKTLFGAEPQIKAKNILSLHLKYLKGYLATSGIKNMFEAIPEIRSFSHAPFYKNHVLYLKTDLKEEEFPDVNMNLQDDEHKKQSNKESDKESNKESNKESGEKSNKEPDKESKEESKEDMEKAEERPKSPKSPEKSQEERAEKKSMEKRSIDRKSPKRMLEVNDETTDSETTESEKENIVQQEKVVQFITKKIVQHDLDSYPLRPLVIDHFPPDRDAVDWYIKTILCRN